MKNLKAYIYIYRERERERERGREGENNLPPCKIRKRADYPLTSL